MSRFRLLAAAVLLAFSTTACIPFITGKTYGFDYKAPATLSVVIYKSASEVLYDLLHNPDFGLAGVRNILASNVPGSFKAEACTPGGLCIGVQDLRSWFKEDARQRTDLDDEINEAESKGECLAWTFIPSRNWTTRENNCKVGRW